MPLFREAQNRSGFDVKTVGLYKFSDEYRQGWKVFWDEMGGDTDKILKWASDAGIESPEEWYTGLYLHLFDTFSGDIRLLHRKAAAAKFGDFVKQTAENHIKDPKDKWWYINQGITQEKFIGMLQRASDIDRHDKAIMYINARIRDLGFRLFEEYILSMTSYKKTLEKQASELNKKAYEIENGAIYDQIRKGDQIWHMQHDEEKLVVEAIMEEGILARKSNGTFAFVQDVWNLQKV